MEEDNKLIQEKNLLDVFEKYSDLQIKYEKEDKHYIDVKIEPYVICLEYNWKQEIWMSILHTIFDKLIKMMKKEIIQYFPMQKM